MEESNDILSYTFFLNFYDLWLDYYLKSTIVTPSSPSPKVPNL